MEEGIVRLKDSEINSDESRRLDQKELSYKWLDKNYDKLKLKYSDNFVAVKVDEVVGYEKDFKKLVRKMQNKYGAEFSTISIRLVEKKETVYIPTVF